MNKYEIIKGAGRTMWMVRADEDVMRFYKRSECEAWIARAIRRDLEITAEKIERREVRLERVNAYGALKINESERAHFVKPIIGGEVPVYASSDFSQTH
jgi:hypothetical protein